MASQVYEETNSTVINKSYIRENERIERYDFSLVVKMGPPVSNYQENERSIKMLPKKPGGRNHSFPAK